MIFHESRLLADDSHVISYLISVEIGKDVSKFAVYCSCDWRFKETRSVTMNIFRKKSFLFKSFVKIESSYVSQ